MVTHPQNDVDNGLYMKLLLVGFSEIMQVKGQHSMWSVVSPQSMTGIFTFMDAPLGAERNCLNFLLYRSHSYRMPSIPFISSSSLFLSIKEFKSNLNKALLFLSWHSLSFFTHPGVNRWWWEIR